MHYDEITQLQSNHPTWKLLRARNAALILSFAGRVFIDANASDIAASVLAGDLEDELYALNQRLGADTYPKSAAAYLDDWASPEQGWLRKFYQPGSDEAHYDLAPSVEKAFLWIHDLRSREFVGTESRLNTIFELLRQMAFGADDDPEHQLVELRRRRAELDEQIAKSERGEIAVLDAVAQRDRYQQFSRTARELLSDFREVEDNFRGLDRSLREQVARWAGSKGELLDDVLGSRSSIADSDQGRSFQAFYDFLLSHHKQAELSDLLERLQKIDAIENQDPRLAHIHFDWIDASERTQATVRLVSEQLRRFLDDQVWLENRRVVDLLRSIEANALALRDVVDAPDSMEIDDPAIPVILPMERPLYRRSRTAPLDSAALQHGNKGFDASALFEQLYVDRDELIQTVRKALARRDQIGLAELVSDVPLQQGLAELVAYLALNEPGFAVVFDPNRREQIEWDAGELSRMADLPAVTYTRERSA